VLVSIYPNFSVESLQSSFLRQAQIQPSFIVVSISEPMTGITKEIMARLTAIRYDCQWLNNRVVLWLALSHRACDDPSDNAMSSVGIHVGFHFSN
jgi:hypothetical protein